MNDAEMIRMLQREKRELEQKLHQAVTLLTPFATHQTDPATQSFYTDKKDRDAAWTWLNQLPYADRPGVRL